MGKIMLKVFSEKSNQGIVGDLYLFICFVVCVFCVDWMAFNYKWYDHQGGNPTTKTPGEPNNALVRPSPSK